MNHNKELSGKVALITGAGKNIGRSIALSLAAAGCAVAVNTRASRNEAEDVVKASRDAGGQAEVFMADVSDGPAVQAMVEGIIKRFGRLDIAVLNAAYRKDVSFEDMDFDEWRRAMSVTLDGAFHCAKASLPHLIKAGGGSIITFAGHKALSSRPGKAHVSASKHGIVGMTRVLARELARHGIRVNCISPGPIHTDLTDTPHIKKTGASDVPLGRQGRPEEIAAMVRFLCGPEGTFITGQTMHINGGTQMTS